MFTPTKNTLTTVLAVTALALPSTASAVPIQGDPPLTPAANGHTAQPVQSSSDGIDPEAARVLRRFIEAIESGELMDSSPQDAVVVRRLEGALTDLDAVPRGGGRESHVSR